jgi:hypothetical protein
MGRTLCHEYLATIIYRPLGSWLILSFYLGIQQGDVMTGEFGKGVSQDD